MGSCYSCSESHELLPPTAKVVSINGNLRQYNVPVFASQVVEAEASSSSSSSSSSVSLILCNSDLLSYDDYIPALDSNAELHENQLYFVLPKSKIQNRLTASDMAALAVKASVALQNASKKNGHRRKRARISPSFNHHHNQQFMIHDVFKTNFVKPTPTKGISEMGMPFSRSGSVRKFHRYTSRRAKLAVRSFRLRLSTIYEGTVLTSN